MNILGRSSAAVTKRDKVCDFLFAFSHTEPLQKMALFFDTEAFPASVFVPLKVSTLEKPTIKLFYTDQKLNHWTTKDLEYLLKKQPSQRSLITDMLQTFISDVAQ